MLQQFLFRAALFWSVLLCLLPTGQVWAQYRATVVIGDSKPRVSISTVQANATEDPATPGVFKISRTGSTSKQLSVRVAFYGRARLNSDYRLPPNVITKRFWIWWSYSVTIPAGASSPTVEW